MTDEWIPPWKPGLPQAKCQKCDTLVVERTLVMGLCAQCAKGTSRKPTEQQQQLDDEEVLYTRP